MKVLVVDDEVLIRWFIEKALKNWGYQVETASSSNEAIDLVKSNDFNVLITDIVMPGSSGIELISHVQKLNKRTNIIACSAFFTEKVLDGFKKTGVHTIKKPFSHQELRESLDQVFLQTA